MLSNLEELLPDQPGAPVMAREFRPLIVPFRTWVVGDIEATLWILLGAVGFLLLLACANVANLFLVRAEARHGEVAIRAALGESRGRLVASVLLESLVLGVAGGLAALLLAQGAVRLLVRFGSPELPRFEEISIDAAVLLFGLAVSLAAGLLFGLLPAWRACALAASGHMTAGARGATSGRDRQLVRRGLVVVQLALALTLLVGSGLAVRSFQRLAVVDPGFDPVDVLTFALALPPRDYDTPDSRLGFYRQVVDRLRALPGAVGAAASSTLPLDGVLNSGGHRIEGRPLAEGDVPRMFAVRVVSPGDFDAMRIALVEGRVFDRLGRGARCTGRHRVAVAGARAVAGRECARQGGSGWALRRRRRARRGPGSSAWWWLPAVRRELRRGRPVADAVRGARAEDASPDETAAKCALARPRRPPGDMCRNCVRVGSGID